VAAVLPNLVGLPGYNATTVPGLVRAIVDVYAAVAVLEDVEGPLIQFGRRYVEQINTPYGRILLVPRKGSLGAVSEMGSGKVASVLPVLKAYLWSAEPVLTGDEMEDELARFDLASIMWKRFLNVLNRVAVGKIELVDIDPDADQSAPAAVNEYGEAHVITFRFRQDVERDGVVFSVIPTLGADGLPTPRLAPPPNYAVDGATLDNLDITTTPTE
jgi:hypothetical protein